MLYRLMASLSPAQYKRNKRIEKLFPISKLEIKIGEIFIN